MYHHSKRRPREYNQASFSAYDYILHEQFHSTALYLLTYIHTKINDCCC
jgi:hypothetical protein